MIRTKKFAALALALSSIAISAPAVLATPTAEATTYVSGTFYDQGVQVNAGGGNLWVYWWNSSTRSWVYLTRHLIDYYGHYGPFPLTDGYYYTFRGNYTWCWNGIVTQTAKATLTSPGAGYFYADGSTKNTVMSTLGSDTNIGYC